MTTVTMTSDITVTPIRHFKDGGWLDRHEYDGSEGWDYNAPFVLPTKVRPVRKLIKGEDDSSWSDMNDLNGDFA